MHLGKTDSIFAITDAIKKVEQTNDKGETVDNTICGLIEKNLRLNYLGNNNAENTTILGVSYDFSEGKRPFPSFEVTVQISVKVISNR